MHAVSSSCSFTSLVPISCTPRAAPIELDLPPEEAPAPSGPAPRASSPAYQQQQQQQQQQPASRSASPTAMGGNGSPSSDLAAMRRVVEKAAQRAKTPQAVFEPSNFNPQSFAPSSMASAGSMDGGPGRSSSPTQRQGQGQQQQQQQQPFVSHASVGSTDSVDAASKIQEAFHQMHQRSGQAAEEKEARSQVGEGVDVGCRPSACVWDGYRVAAAAARLQACSAFRDCYSGTGTGHGHVMGQEHLPDTREHGLPWPVRRRTRVS